MFHITYDAASNRVTVKVADFTIDEVFLYIEEFNKVMEQVKPGFSGLTHLTDGNLFSQEVTAALAPLGDIAVQKGVGKWAYITGSAVAKMQMRRMFGDVVTAFETEEEAEAYLVGYSC